MAGELTITASDVRPVEIIEQITAPASVDLDAGALVKLDSNGKLAKAAGDSAANAIRPAILLTSCKAGTPGTAVRKGKVYLGAALAAAYASAIYASNTAGLIATSAGTASIVVGYVEPVWSEATPLKVLSLNN